MTPSHDDRETGPERVDMRDVLWPVEDVGRITASAASAAVTALEYHCNRLGEPPTNLSSMFVHYNARVAAGQEQANVGTTMEAVMRAIAAHGACPEGTWPFDPATLAVRPPVQAYDEARRFATVHYSNPADPLEALAMRYPVPFVARVPERCLREAGRTGVMPAPTPDECQRADGQVNHAMVLVGYDKAAKTFVARNCWGAQWGDQGHCTLPFDVLHVIAPSGTQRLWVITAAEGRKGAEQPLDQVRSAAGTPAPAPAPPRLSDLAARMREEIRGDVQRDLADATRRIREMVDRGAGAAPRPVGALDVCPTCDGKGACPTCAGRGCTNCGSGNCPRCGGRGTA